jgi:hypothetical protein
MKYIPYIKIPCGFAAGRLQSIAYCLLPITYNLMFSAVKF